MENKILFRTIILSQLEAISPASISPTTLENGLKISGFNCTPNQLNANLDYLCQKGFIEMQQSKISAGDVRIKLSAMGRDYIESGDF